LIRKGKDLMEREAAWREAKRIDVHNHVRRARGGQTAGSGEALDVDHAERLLAKGEKLGIDCFCVSVPLTGDAPTPDQVRAANDAVLEAMRMSDRFLGFCFVNPGDAAAALEEMERCIVEGGMMGVKLYHQYVVCDPAQRPVMERAAELGVPVLMHAGKVTDTENLTRQPRLSHAGHFLKAAEMFPETPLIQGHIGGGGDWEWNLRVLEEAPANVYIDTSGSVIDTGIVDRTVATLGVDRVLFATDGILEEGVGKLLEANLDEADRARVFGGNVREIFARRRG